MKSEKWTDEKLRLAVSLSYSVSEALRHLDLKPWPGNYNTFWRHVKRLDINTDHFLGRAWNKGKKGVGGSRIPLSEILVRDSKYSSTWHLRNRLINESIFEDKCSVCSTETWQGKKLSMHLDHINGIRNDNRLENLRLLCPNCHSQTDTYAGKNRGINLS